MTEAVGPGPEADPPDSSVGPASEVSALSAAAGAVGGAANTREDPLEPGKKSFGRLAKQGVAWSIFRAGAVELVATPTAMILARLLTPFDFGVAASVSFFAQLAAKVTNLGFNQALVRLRTITNEHCAFVFVADLAAGVVSYLVLVSTSQLIAVFFRAPQVAEVMPVVALTFLIGPLGTVSAALMSRDMDFKKTATSAWVGGLSEAIACIGLAAAGFGYWSIVYGRVAGQVGVTGSKMVLKPWRPSVRFSSQAAWELFGFGTGVFAKRLLDYAANNLDNLVVARALGVATLGFYDKAFVAVNKVLVRLNTGGPAVSFRIFSLIYEDGERFRRAYAKVILGATLVSYPTLAGLAGAGRDVIGVLFGPRWEPVIVPFQILCVAGALKIVNEYAGSAAQAWGRIWGQVWVQVGYTVLIVVCVTLFSSYGLPGAASGVLVATVAMTILMGALVMRTAAIPLIGLLRPQLPGVLSAALVAITVVAARFSASEWIGLSNPWHLLPVEVLGGTLAYVAYLKLCPFRDVRELIRETAEELPSRFRRLARVLV